MLYDLTSNGRALAEADGIDAGPPPRAGLEHRYWVSRVAEQFERQGFDVTHEFHIPGAGHVDLAAERPGERVAIEVETGKSDVDANIEKLQGAGFDRILFVATSPTAAVACRRALKSQACPIELLSWLDL